MDTKKNQATNNSLLISGTLVVLPVVLLAANRMLMVSGPGRGVPTYALTTATTIFPVLAVMISGFSLYNSLRTGKDKKRQLLSAIIFVASLTFLTLFAWDYMRFYNLTH